MLFCADCSFNVKTGAKLQLVAFSISKTMLCVVDCRFMIHFSNLNQRMLLNSDAESILLKLANFDASGDGELADVVR